jgi:hypothetical protein
MELEYENVNPDLVPDVCCTDQSCASCSEMASNLSSCTMDGACTCDECSVVGE